MRRKANHPKGEREMELNFPEIELIPVDTFGGRVHVKWDNQASLTPLGQLAFFIEFLKTSGHFERWVSDCPMDFTSPNAPMKRDVLGTILLSVLSGHTRYSHITTIRCDGVNPQLLGMNKVVSDDAVGRALKYNLEEAAGIKWSRESLKMTYYPLLSDPWILDVDTSVKVLYGKQEGAVVGYNPKKPGRPSHVYHAYMIANIRLILDVEVQAGNKNASKYTAPGLWTFLNALPESHRPAFIRGDSGFGTDAIMREAEATGQKYLFKLKQTANVKKLIRRYTRYQEWVHVRQGWEGIESSIKLQGWDCSRRVVILRRLLPKDLGVMVQDRRSGQLEIQFPEIKEDLKVYEYGVMVTSLEDEISTIAQHYRDRADSENNFDELKNQWGWCGFTTRDLKRSQMMAKIIALVYNWWTLFVRLIEPKKHMEALTSRPLLLHAVGKKTIHANQTTLVVSSTHGESPRIHRRLAHLSQFFKNLNTTTPQLTIAEKWYRILSVAFIKYLKGRILKPPDLIPAVI